MVASYPSAPAPIAYLTAASSQYPIAAGSLKCFLPTIVVSPDTIVNVMSPTTVPSEVVFVVEACVIVSEPVSVTVPMYVPSAGPLNVNANVPVRSGLQLVVIVAGSPKVESARRSSTRIGDGGVGAGGGSAKAAPARAAVAQATANSVIRLPRTVHTPRL